MSDSKIIVVSGVTAGGKTTLIQSLSRSIDSHYIISFDDYSFDAFPSAPSFDFFLENEKEAVNQYDLTLLINDLIKVRNKYDMILVDFPFGYEHDTLRPYIDTVIYLKTPLDVVFARQIIRDYSDKDKDDILNWANTYLNYARPIFLKHEKLISSSADYILDGTINAEELVKKLKNESII